MSLEQTYIQYGIPSNWAHNYGILGIPSSTFKQTSKRNLISRYNIPEAQIDFVKNCLTRKPIDQSVLQKLLERNNFTCCLCKETKNNGYIIHHIVEYSKTQDNSYSNLAVLCLDHHDLAHRQGISLTNRITKEQIKQAKTNWETYVKKVNPSKATNKPIRGKLTDWRMSNPFKELLSFSESDKDYFFGRQIEKEELLQRIYKYNIVGLFGESGTGKTSLVNAGMIPIFRKEGFISISVRCFDEPIKRIRYELLKVLRESYVSVQLTEELAATDTFPHLIHLLKTIINKENLKLIIVIDQFEELFTRARENEKEQLSKGISEALIPPPQNGKIYFLLSLREDYIGDLWDWAHLYNLEGAWIHQYRIKRLSEEKAHDAIIQPLLKLGIKSDVKFVDHIISELKNIGDSLIYPPYLQIVCSILFEEYKNQNVGTKPSIIFDQNLFKETDTVESILADYLSETMLQGLTDEEKIYAQNILDLLTGPQGLRTFLDIEEISRFLSISNENLLHTIEHLIKKKIIHPIVENDIVIGYELVHDFLSKKFFDKLGPDAKINKTTIEIFRKAYKEWKQHGVLASKDRLEILFPNIKHLNLNDEEWTFILKSSFSVYWNFENKWTDQISKDKLAKICLQLLQDKTERICEHAISTLGKVKGKEITPVLKEIIESAKTTISIKDAAIQQFMFYISDKRILKTLKKVIKTNKSFKLRKSAVYAFANNISKLSKADKNIIDLQIGVIFEALNDPKTEVRRQAADIFYYTLVTEKAVNPLIERLQKETSISARKAIVVSLGSLLRNKFGANVIPSLLEEISQNDHEDYRVREEARRGLFHELDLKY